MRPTALLAAALVLGSAACGPRAPAGHPARTAGGGSRPYDPAVAPTPREILRALLSVRDLPLAADPSCATAGTSAADTDLGDYVSGWLAELREGSGQNWIETSTTAETDSATGAQAWRSGVVFRHVDGDDRWGWGVSFLMSGTDRRVLAASVRCTGAG